jgi:Amt family ammonium transporter
VRQGYLNAVAWVAHASRVSANRTDSSRGGPSCHFTLIFIALLVLATMARAQTPTPASSPTLEQRVADLEAYVNNSARGSDAATAPTTSAILGPGPGHNAWLMTSTLLVLFMTLPGLALFYGGLVRQKNVLSILAQCLGIAGLVTILWWAIGYSLVFAPGSAFFGGGKFAFLRGVTSAPNTDYSFWVSHNLFAMYQLMFAIITPALIIGSVAERMKFSGVLAFVALWMFLVYFPLAHMVWGIDGLMNGVWNPHARIRAIDFAGGTVVHMSSGWSALLLCIFLGPRLGFRREIMAPHSMVLCMVGTGMLWVGWYGFNAGSALGADEMRRTHSCRPRWQRRWHHSHGRRWSGFCAASQVCSVFALARSVGLS